MYSYQFDFLKLFLLNQQDQFVLSTNLIESEQYSTWELEKLKLGIFFPPDQHLVLNKYLGIQWIGFDRHHLHYLH